MPLFPFNVYADTITSVNIVGVNRTLVNTSFIESHTVNISPLGDIVVARYSYEYEITVQLDDYYLGYINGSFSTSMTDVNYSDGSLYNRTATKQNMSYYVNGNSFTTSFSTIACFRVIQGSNNDPTGTYNTTFNLNTSNITKYQDLDSIESVINILNDIHNDVSINVLDELQDIITKLDLCNDYLEYISLLRQYNIKVCSLPLMFSLFNKGQKTVDYFIDYYFNYPVFQIDNSKAICSFNIPGNTTMYLCFMDTLSSPATSYYYFSPNTNISYEYTYTLSTQYVFIHVMKITNSGSNSLTTNLIGRNGQRYFIPFYYGDLYDIDTELALFFHVDNHYLNMINQIANGTSASTDSSNDLEDSADDIVQNSSTMFQFENTQNQNMNNALQQINTSYDIGSLGSSFLASANWVKTQFDNLTGTTPFGSVLSFSLLLGLALLIIGKVYK